VIDRQPERLINLAHVGVLSVAPFRFGMWERRATAGVFHQRWPGPLLRSARAAGSVAATRADPVAAAGKLPSGRQEAERMAAGAARHAHDRVSSRQLVHARGTECTARPRRGARDRDHPDRPFQTHEATTTWRHVRFHYGTRGRGGNYSASEIHRWATLIDQRQRQTDVFAYFNSDWRGFAPANARSLLRRLNSGG
jgi:Protein of unknown function DUF72